MKKPKTLLFVFLVIALSFFSFRSLLRPGYFPMHDDMQPIRVLGIDQCLRDGQFPCRWVPDLGYGYGYPLFIYYSPLAYYFMEVFYLIGFSFLGAIKIEFILTIVFSGLAMFLLGKSLWGNFGGLISAVFYVYAPYRATDVYSRGAVGEFTALVFLPLIFWAILELVRQGKTKYMIFLGLSFGGLLLTHNITSLIFTPAAVFFGILLLWYYKKWHLLPKLILGSLLGIGVASFFILPVVFEKSLVHVETMTYGYFNFLAHFVSLGQMFFSSHWGYGSSEFGPDDDFSFAIGLIHWFSAFVAIILGFWQRKKKSFPFLVFSCFIIIGLAAAFLAHPRSVFIWNKINLLSFLQFPWRFLAIIIFAFSAMAGGIILYFKKYALLVGSLMILAVIVLNFNYFRPADWFPTMKDEDKFSGQLWEKQVTASIFDYLPVFAKAPPAGPAPDNPEAVSGEIKVLNFKKGTDWQEGELEVLSSEAKVRLPLFYFPNFELLVDNEKAIIDYKNDLGLITFDLTQGEHNFYVKLKKTPIRIIGDLVSLASLLFIGGWLINEKKHIF